MPYRRACAASAFDRRGRDLTGAVGDERDRDVAPLVAHQAADLDRQVGEHARVVPPALRAEAEQPRQIAPRRPAEIDARVQAAVEEAHPDVGAPAADQRQLLRQRQRQPAREHLARAAHRGAGVDQDVVQRARDLVLPLVPVIEQIVGQRLQREHVVVVGQLAGQERVDVAAPLDRGVPVDREALRAGPALGLEQRRQQLQREVDDVGGARRPDDVKQVGEIGRRAVERETGRTAGPPTARSARGAPAACAPARTSRWMNGSAQAGSWTRASSARSVS